MREALDVLGVERIDHGNRALEDPELVARLRDERVPLTVCPLSNVALKGVPRIEDHPLPRMLELGLVATVNSDDPAYFGGGIDANLAALTDVARDDRRRPRRARRQLVRGRVRRRGRPGALAGRGGRLAHVSQAVATSRASSWAFSALSASSTACAFSPDGQRAKAVRAAPSAM